jgi:hypothetical protein
LVGTEPTKPIGGESSSRIEPSLTWLPPRMVGQGVDTPATHRRRFGDLVVLMFTTQGTRDGEPAMAGSAPYVDVQPERVRVHAKNVQKVGDSLT